MKRLTLLFTLLLVAAAFGEPRSWDGTNPFNCVEQDVGTGTEFPDPGADPFCVKFDKTNQNVTDFGIVRATDGSSRMSGNELRRVIGYEPMDTWPEGLPFPVAVALQRNEPAGRLQGELDGVPVFNVSVPVLGRDFWELELTVAERAPSAIT